MYILSIDTSNKTTSIDISNFDDKNIKSIYSKTFDSGLTHSQDLIPLIDKCLKKSNLNIQNIDYFGITNGPGSFTGLRIGLATLKGFSIALNKKIVGVSTLNALAYNEISSNYEYICPIIYARNDNVYTCLFKKEENDLKLIIDYTAQNINEFANIVFNKIGNTKVIFVGDGTLYYKKQIKEILKLCKFSNKKNTVVHADTISKLAYKQIQNGKIPGNVSIEYLRKSQAEQALDKKGSE